MPQICHLLRNFVMKKIKKKSLLHLAVFIAIGMSCTGLVYHNDLSAAQQKKPKHWWWQPKATEAWFGDVRKRLADTMHKIINQLKKINKQIKVNKTLNMWMEKRFQKLKEDFDRIKEWRQNWLENMKNFDQRLLKLEIGDESLFKSRRGILGAK